MRQLPQLERRPDATYYIAQTLGRGCLTGSFAVNLVRLGAVLLIVPSMVLVFTTTNAALLLGVGIVALISSYVWRPATATRHAQRAPWTRDELTMSSEAAAAQGGDIVAMLRHHHDNLAIDYGATLDGQRPILVAPKLRRAHQLITGGSGAGKSKFIATQAAQGAVLGAVLAVVDPHEELAQDILCMAAPVLARQGAIILWPDGPTPHCYPWNPLWTGPGREPWQAADNTVGAVKRVWKLTDANTYIIDVLKHTTWALAGAGWTLLEGARFLTDDTFRLYIAEACNIPEVQHWVDDFNRLSHRDRRDLSQTTLVRLQRLNANPHLKRLIGCGVTDAHYQQALTAQGLTAVPGADLVHDLNSGRHLFAVVPKRVLGEDQYVVAGLVQSAILTAALSRKPNDPAMPELEAYLDEAGAYANAEGLGVVLAQARKYKLSAMVAMQGLMQAELPLAQELERNSAVKVVFGTDSPDEATRAAQMLFRYDPSQVKIDARERIKVGDTGERRDHGQFQTYSPQEQQAYWSGTILTLPPRQYVLKLRGEAQTPLLAYTPEYTSTCGLDKAMRAVQRRRGLPLVTVQAIDQELALRQRWLDSVGYGKTLAPVLTTLEPATNDRARLQAAHPHPGNEGRGATSGETVSPLPAEADHSSDLPVSDDEESDVITSF